jgi:hypothetical protein
VKDLRSGSDRFLAGNRDPPETAMHLSQVPDSHHRLLTEIAALRVADGLARATNLGCKAGFVDVSAIGRHPAFDPQDVMG